MADLSIISEAPKGFSEALNDACQLPSPLLEEVCCDTLKFLRAQIPSLPASKYLKKLPADNTKSVSEIQNVLCALQYLFRAVQRAGMSSEGLREELAQCSVLTEAARTALLQAWNHQAKETIVSVDGVKDFHIGQLEDVQWKVGMAVTSDSCRHLNSPYVTLLLTVSDSDGNQHRHCLELSLAQFRNFSNQLKDIARHMETV